MSMLQQLKQIPITFDELAYKILKQLISISKSLKFPRVDFVTDRYPDITIKEGEHPQRSSSNPGHFNKIVSDNQTMEEVFSRTQILHF